MSHDTASHSSSETTPNDAASSEAVLKPQEGLGVLHLFYTVDLGAWSELTTKEQLASKAELEELVAQARQEPQTTVVTLSMLSRADIGFMILSPNLHRLNILEKRISNSLGGILVKEFSYLSLTERSEYTPKEEEYALELETKEGLMRGTAESDAKLASFRDRIKHYTHDRLYPVLPAWEYYCFYPMSKRRAAGQNWYALDYNRRKELMLGHMSIGRTFAGRVRQLVTGSTGIDDWEWGVTLFSHDPAEIKAIVYQMRFDEVSHTYAEFGPFYNGLPLPIAEIYKRVLLTV